MHIHIFFIYTRIYDGNPQDNSVKTTSHSRPAPFTNSGEGGDKAVLALRMQCSLHSMYYR